MNVSSVKNLNGETFSAVQDATLTNVVQSNSAQWAEGGSTSGFVSGTNTLFVPYYPGASDGRVYSANISGDVSVSTGYYSNSGANIDILRTYSLSSVGSQIGDKLNKSVIENSKTLSIIDNKAEVYSFAYKPSELVFTGITVNNYSSPDSVSITTTIQPPYKLYSACLVIESDGFDTNRIPNGWNFVNSANGSATFSRFYKNQSYDSINFPGFWDYSLTNASAYSVAYSGLVIDALAFKSDLTGVAGDPEVNSLVHTNSATWNTVTDKLDTTAFSDVSGTFLTAVNIPESATWNDTSNVVQSNSAQWSQGGGDVPEDVMVESAIGYNAVGEISAYGNSAIAQYGAEKQWLVHDDTLVHASNSAQYALGVNISALQRLMGIDETVLFENANGVNEDIGFTISEPFTNFERIRYIGNTNSNNYSVEVPTYDSITSVFRFGVACMCPDSDGAPLQIYGKTLTSNNGLTYIGSRSEGRWFDYNNKTSVNGTQPFWGKTYKIIGIGRRNNT